MVPRMATWRISALLTPAPTTRRRIQQTPDLDLTLVTFGSGIPGDIHAEEMLEEKIGRHPALKQIRGLGLMIGVEFDFEAKPLVLKMMEHGVLANATAGNVLRLVPPLVISFEELERLVEVIALSLKEIH